VLGSTALLAVSCYGISVLTGPLILLAVAGCTVGVGGFFASSIATANLASSFVTDLTAAFTATKQAAFYWCLMQGGSYWPCREQVGITDQELGQAFEE
jgi:uncharacterized membrane protein YjjP (DUF1212 family)